MSRVVVTVMPRAETLDPQGQAVAGALHQLGFADLADVRIGKRIVLEIDGDDPIGQAHAMCDRLLVNRLIEDYEVQAG
jgi:phosphoribosylformylglycinamidine synthase